MISFIFNLVIKMTAIIKMFVNNIMQYVGQKLKFTSE